jgi:hypothetical protein
MNTRDIDALSAATLKSLLMVFSGVEITPDLVDADPDPDNAFIKWQTVWHCPRLDLQITAGHCPGDPSGPYFVQIDDAERWHADNLDRALHDALNGYLLDIQQKITRLQSIRTYIENLD